jgi:tetratricopeptide (TPR) repeat protein
MTGGAAARPARAGATAPGDLPGGGRLAALIEALGLGAERLLVGASVYREPADRNALLFQVGQHDWTAARAPGRRGPAPPYTEPADLGGMLAACEATGLLTVGFAAPGRPADRYQPDGPEAARPDLPTVFVDRWTAFELHRVLQAANRGHDLAAAHLRAAEYWRWRSAAWPQQRHADLHDLLEARHHLRQAGETGQACELTEAVCSQLHAWGDLGREAALISDTLAWLPTRSAHRAACLHELGKIAQVRADYTEAERCYQQALDVFAAVGDRSGVSRSHHSLGVLAQAQGAYATAEFRYQEADDAAMCPAAGPAARSAGDPPSGLAGPPAAPPPGPVAAHEAQDVTAPETRAADPAAPLRAAPLPAATRPAATRPAPAGTATAPRHASAFARPGRPTWWRMPGLTAVSAALLALSAAGITGAFPSAGQASLPASRAMTAAAAVRQEAAAWVGSQVSRSAIVACDPAMCSVLQAQGVPAGDLLGLGPAEPDPLGSDVVVATTAVRSEFGQRLGQVYAPVVLARFGSGSARVAIRVIAPDGAAAYRRALAADLAARRRAGAQLLGNPRLSVSAPARRQLADGMVDSRLLTTLAALTGQAPVRVISFDEPAPGASVGVPLRSAKICDPATAGAPGGIGPAVGGRTTRASSAAYVRSVLGFLRAQRAPYLATVIRAIRLPRGQAAVRIGFASPSPLGLLP